MMHSAAPLRQVACLLRARTDPTVHRLRRTKLLACFALKSAPAGRSRSDVRKRTSPFSYGRLECAAWGPGVLAPLAHTTQKLFGSSCNSARKGEHAPDRGLVCHAVQHSLPLRGRFDLPWLAKCQC